MTQEELLEQFCYFLRITFMDNTDEEADTVWRHDVSMNNTYGEETLASLAYIIDNPPSNLLEIMEEHGGIATWQPGDTPEGAIAWLKTVYGRFKAIYEQRPPPES